MKQRISILGLVTIVSMFFLTACCCPLSAAGRIKDLKSNGKQADTPKPKERDDIKDQKKLDVAKAEVIALPTNEK